MKEKGMALAVALILLMIMTIGGILVMSSAVLQERMSGNSRLQALAFEAASLGVATSLEQIDTLPQPCNQTTLQEWYGPWSDPRPVGQASLRQRVYCLPFYANEDPTPTGYELFVLNRGEVTSNNQVLAQRDVEVRVGRVGGVADDPCNGVAVCIPKQPDLEIPPTCGSTSSSDFCSCAFAENPFSGFQSNAFSVVGDSIGESGYGPAMAFPPNLRLAFECAITGGSTAEQCQSDPQGRCSRLGNYVGGLGTINTSNVNPPWDNPQRSMEFLQELRQLSLDGDPNITYVDGDLTMTGSTSGSGILVVEGKLEWRGTPSFDGLIIVLGGDFEVRGGGQGGDGAGSVVMLNLDPKPSQFSSENPPPPRFLDDLRMRFGGSGTATYAFGCDELWDTWETLGPAGRLDPENLRNSLQQLWIPLCSPDGGEPVGTRNGVVSWRENIGWRREDFPGSQNDG